MYKCLLWGTGKDFSRNINLVKWYEDKGIINILGVTSKSHLYKSIYGYPFIKKTELSRYDIDIIIIMAENALLEIEKEVQEIKKGIPTLACPVLTIPNLEIDKYLSIKSNCPTIFANNCWGGLLYHQLRLPFISPFINMFLHDEDYLLFLENPKKYIGSQIELFSVDYDNTLGREYPVCRCEDIHLHFNHYDTFESAKENWNKRCKRICWNNIFVMMHTQDRRVAERFSELPYENKVCFVPFEMDKKGIVPIVYNDNHNVPFFEVVNGIVTGQYSYFNMVDILLGEFKKVIT